jgi:hypothetical protein
MLQEGAASGADLNADEEGALRARALDLNATAPLLIAGLVPTVSRSGNGL